MKRITIALLCLLMSLAALGQDVSYVLDKDISYSTKKDPYSRKRLKLDVYHPKKGGDCPVLVWFHGGGLTGGHKSVPEALKEQGLVVVAVNYRLLPAVTVRDAIDDAAEAVAWTFRNISSYGGSPSRIYVSGHSAGGYLTMMLGFNREYLARYGADADAIAALLPLSGQAISHFAYRDMNGMGALQPLVDEYAPLYWVRNDCPPTLLVTGDREDELYGRYEENAYLWRMMKLSGHPSVTLVEHKGTNHNTMLAPGLADILEYIKGK